MEKNVVYFCIIPTCVAENPLDSELKCFHDIIMKIKGGTTMMEEIILNNIWATLQAIQREMERQTELLQRIEQNTRD